jgi:hypothetical protein
MPIDLTKQIRRKGDISGARLPEVAYGEEVRPDEHVGVIEWPEGAPLPEWPA